jgi:hypothetical protein
MFAVFLTEWYEFFSSFVINGAIVSADSLSSQVSIGSKCESLSGRQRMTFKTSSTETDEKDGKRCVVDVETGSPAFAVNNHRSATFFSKKSFNLSAEIDLSACV